MTTISPRRKKRNLYPALFVALVGGALISAIIVWRTEVGGLFWSLAAPLAQLRNSLDATESARLRAELASTTAALADRNALYQENLRIKQGFGRDARVKTTLASVLMRPPGVPYDTLLVDAGSGQGVKKGALVSAGGSAYIGVVSDVYKSSSRVVLFSAPGATYEALVVTKHAGSIPISLVGGGAGSMSAQVPAATPASVGDSVVVPGIATAFAGEVTHIQKTEGDSFETLFIHLPVDLFALQFIEIRLEP